MEKEISNLENYRKKYILQEIDFNKKIQKQIGIQNQLKVQIDGFE